MFISDYLSRVTFPETVRDYKDQRFIVSSVVVLFATLWLASNYHRNWKTSVASFFIRKFRKMPIPGGNPIQKQIDKELHKADVKMDEEAQKKMERVSVYTRLPESGVQQNVFLDLLDNLGREAIEKSHHGHLSGTIYADPAKDAKFAAQIYERTCFTNPLHPSTFAYICKMEAAAVQMISHLYEGDDKTVGMITSGGTDSIMEAMRAYRKRAENLGIKNPVLLAPESAHAAFEKAAQSYHFELIKIQTDNNGEVRISEMERVLNEYRNEAALKKQPIRVMGLVGSIQSYPYGSMDPLEELSKLALAYDVPMHGDACLASFVTPYLKGDRKIGFANPGMITISVDPHKYGGVPKGSSVVLYRDENWMKLQFYSISDWQGGLYTTPGRLGSRPGAIIAETYGMMIEKGESWYRNQAEQISKAREDLLKEIRTVPGIKVIGNPKQTVIAFTSDKFNIYSLGDDMAAFGFELNKLQMPPALHICLTLHHCNKEFQASFLQALRTSAEARMAQPNAPAKGEAAVYGSLQMLPREVGADALDAYTASYLRVKPKFDHSKEPPK